MSKLRALFQLMHAAVTHVSDLPFVSGLGSIKQCKVMQICGGSLSRGQESYAEDSCYDQHRCLSARQALGLTDFSL